jgi:hypothetical protein
MANDASSVRATHAIITIREALALGGFLVVAFGAWAALLSDVRALGVRVGATEVDIAKIRDNVQATRDTVIELRSEQHVMARQVGRIEALLTGAPPGRPQ